ncbi:hypothetical protein J437_LFUL016017 [Ladona fulva]|uniref:Uncharacterized protein n=1 Tax=Ladona fulva TaxID=123851 RepID=A0A8K0KFW4_LADFU|nr:hypothetical protein J437_LFUL016017 [Ladona fulva]
METTEISGEQHHLSGVDLSDGMISLFFYTPSFAAPPPLTVLMDIEGVSITMEVDSGADESNVTYRNKRAELLLLVPATPGPSLLGRTWFRELGISVSGVNNLSCASQSLPHELLDFNEVFCPGLGQYSGPPVHLHMKPDLQNRDPSFELSMEILEIYPGHSSFTSSYLLHFLLGSRPLMSGFRGFEPPPLSQAGIFEELAFISLPKNADFLSRCPIEDDCVEDFFPDPAGILLLEEAPLNSPFTAKNVADATSKDPVLSKVLQGLLNGWDFSENEPAVQPYIQAPPGTFSVLKGCVLRGTRVVIPDALRPHVLQLLHKVHQGVVKTKALALGDRIFYRVYNSNCLWLPGEISAVEEPRTFHISTANGLTVRRHLNQLRKRHELVPNSDFILQEDSPYYFDPFHPASQTVLPHLDPASSSPLSPASLNVSSPPPEAHPDLQSISPLPPDLERSESARTGRPRRDPRPPAYLKDFVRK